MTYYETKMTDEQLADVGPLRAIYEEQIAPLVNKIQELCEQHDIHAIQHFDLDKTDRGWVSATTMEFSEAKGLPAHTLLASLMLDGEFINHDDVQNDLIALITHHKHKLGGRLSTGESDSTGDSPEVAASAQEQGS